MTGGWFYFLPIVFIIAMLSFGFTPMLAVIYSIFSIIAIYLIKMAVDYFRALPAKRPSVGKLSNEIGNTMLEALEDGGKGAVPVALACATAGIIVGVITQSGLGFKIGTFAMNISGGQLMPVLILTMITSLVLGMGIPTTANYIITATIAAPAILGIMAADSGMTAREFVTANPEAALSAHMFAFYFGVAADLTPPVALAAYAGAAIAHSDPMKTAVKAFMIGIGKYLVPYMFVYYPVLLLIGVDSLQGALLCALMLVFTVATIYSVNAGTIGYLFGKTPPALRVVYILAGLAMVAPPIPVKLAGLAVFIVFATWQWFKSRSRRQNPWEESTS
jgi:TRAP transporter 4TM/12TM fusion protein